MTDPDQIRPGDFNRAIIAEFRANGGKVGGMFEGAPLVLLTTVGARSGHPHTVPVVYRRDADRLLVFGSNANADTHPAWYYNVRVNPGVTVEVGTEQGIETYTASASILEGAERDRHYAAQASDNPAFDAYQAATDRVIPVVALRPPARPGLGRRRFLAGAGATVTVAAGVAGALAVSAAPEPAAPTRQRAAAIGDHLRQVHAQLRRDLATVRAGLDGHSNAPDVVAKPTLPQELRTHCVAFCSALHEHHTSEDGVFPRWSACIPSWRPWWTGCSANMV
ncbi:nitroreductase/quinone reductase family protein [Nocardia sp. 2YAB30]|uniref:nitroreductase/quinone reductase family protein n=1 Tax=unclassified Nocardia TaxID=2637762 RepID=UPI003F95FF3B